MVSAKYQVDTTVVIDVQYQSESHLPHLIIIRLSSRRTLISQVSLDLIGIIKLIYSQLLYSAFHLRLKVKDKEIKKLEKERMDTAVLPDPHTKPGFITVSYMKIATAAVGFAVDLDILKYISIYRAFFIIYCTND